VVCFARILYCTEVFESTFLAKLQIVKIMNLSLRRSLHSCGVADLFFNILCATLNSWHVSTAREDLDPIYSIPDMKTDSVEFASGSATRSPLKDIQEHLP